MSKQRYKAPKVEVSCKLCGKKRIVKAELVEIFDVLVCAGHREVTHEQLGLKAAEGYYIAVNMSVAGYFRGYRVVATTPEYADSFERALSIGRAGMGYTPGNAVDKWSQKQASPEFAYEHVYELAENIFEAVLETANPGEETSIITLSATMPVFGYETGGNFDLHSQKSRRFHNDDWQYTTDNGETFGMSGDPDIYIDIIACGLIDIGSIVIRTFTKEKDPVSNLPIKTVTAWRLEEGKAHTLTEAEVFSAFCTDADTGEPIPPEPAVKYMASKPLKV